MTDSASLSKSRTIRSFSRRTGRMTQAQKNAMTELWEHYGVDVDTNTRNLDLDKYFPRQAPRFLEIGFGMGNALIEMAQNNPDNDYIGIDVHSPGVGSVLARIEEEGLTNVKVMCYDAMELLKRALAPECLDTVYLFFPDPWPKARHHKRRIVRPEFLADIHRILKPQGIFHMATDWENYAEQMLQVTDAFEGLENTAGTGHYTPRPDVRPLTKFEQRGQRLGHGIWDLVYKKT